MVVGAARPVAAGGHGSSARWWQSTSESRAIALWDPKKSWLPTPKRRLGQVVIAGHGSEHGVETGTTITVDANVDSNADGKKDSFVKVKPHDAKVTASVLNVREKPSLSAKIIDTVNRGDIVLVMGRIVDNSWSLIDHGGKIGYLFSKYLA